MKTNLLRMPGATLVTRLKVYDTAGPDGQLGGTPHFHQACTEMYFVLSGSGAVEIIDVNGFKTVELPAHSAFIFSAGTLHRLITKEGMELLIVMQNSGLPERGDTIATFRNEILADELRFHQAMKIQSLADAYRRRDQAVEGFLEVKAAFAKSLDEGRKTLAEVFRLSNKLSKHNYKEWYDCVVKGAFGEAQETLAQIIDLTAGKYPHLSVPQHHFIPPVQSNTVGFCGMLNRYFDPATALPEGVTI
ncbi:MAG TPA: cupin domain-containing protein [Planctomycetota bacterium]|nr:cupin domain-containing protein [Planctomycetota bacterium]